MQMKIKLKLDSKKDRENIIQIETKKTQELNKNSNKL